jgi:signal transduction histidine kinase
MTSGKRWFPFSLRLFFSVTLLFTAFVSCFVLFQYHREKTYRIDVLNTRLQDYNSFMSQSLASDIDSISIASYIEHHSIASLRVTLIASNGKVLYDSRDHDFASMPNHSGRREIMMAFRNGSGYSVKRNSETTHDVYFYSATYFPEYGYFIRSSLPYGTVLSHILSVDRNYLWFASVIYLLLLAVMFLYSRRIGININQLRLFASKAENDDDIASGEIRFPNDELGDISGNIVHLYTKLQNSEDDKTRLKRQLTQNVAHELKTPVSSIQGYLETIVNDPDMDEETRAGFIERCYAQSVRLSELLRDISLLTKIEDAPASFGTASVNICEIVNSVRSEYEKVMAEKKIRFFNLVDKDVNVKGIRQLLYSVFRNLTENSVKYAGDGVIITVKVIKETSDSYYFSFADNGKGVDPEHLPHLFERFYRVDDGRSRSAGGTGLGLAIVKNAVKLHNGTISAGISRTGGLEFIFGGIGKA